ncbi:MAG TPA: oxygen-independent coproporphyrinogen III oxidase [Pseudomonadota bacterium]|nr:oxygen-independent coproporphyrinogen III oxidase [Pseudomonadota bacterium]
MSATLLNPVLLDRYGQKPLPRYTSYPPANLWHEATEELAIRALSSVGRRPLSLYIHIPFCHKLCLYCGCNMMVTQKQDLVERYISALEREVERAVSFLPPIPIRPEIVQIHIGGGTPTYLSSAQLERVWRLLSSHFRIEKGIEASIEVHPPVTTHEQLECLSSLGFNRISMGVQDFDPIVQKRVNRPQPYEQTRDLIEASRHLGFQSVNVDLMYGLPLQTTERFAHTLDCIQSLMPDRIALFGYAHMPAIRKHQAVFLSSELPDSKTRAALFESALTRLLSLGYVYVGLDHFVLPGDELLAAREIGQLRRNFMGYTTCKQSDVLAFGSSSISEIGPYYFQNARDVKPYCEHVEQNSLPVHRGYSLNRQDVIRRDLIMQLLCNLKLDFRAFSDEHGIAFRDFFANELQQLHALCQDGLCKIEQDTLHILPPGQLLLRVVASVFDETLSKPAPRHHAAAV